MVYETFWLAISYFGDVQFYLGLTAATLIFYQIISKEDKLKIDWIFISLLPSIIVSYLIVSLAKDFFQIPRPCSGQIDCPSDYSFPSGHATAIAAFATIVSLETRKRRLYIFVVPISILVALSRVFLNYHTFSDVAAGAVIGTLVALVFYRYYKPIHNFLEEKKIIS